MRSYDLLDGIQLLQLLRADPRTAVRYKGEMRVAGDATTICPIRELNLLLVVDRSKGQKIWIKIIGRADVSYISMLLQSKIGLQERRHRQGVIVFDHASRIIVQV